MVTHPIDGGGSGGGGGEGEGSRKHLRFITLNIRGGHRNKLATMRDDFDKQDPDAMLFVDVGWLENTPSDDISSRFNGHKVYTLGSDLYPSRSMILVVHRRLAPANDKNIQVERDPECRYIIVRFKVRGITLQIMGVYMPPGLDTGLGPASYSRQVTNGRRTNIRRRRVRKVCRHKRQDAMRVSACIVKAAGRANTRSVVMGDMNETTNGELDRVLTTKGMSGQGTFRADSTIGELLHAHDFTDVWRARHPAAREYTWFDSTTPSRSRLDYILTYPPLSEAQLENSKAWIGEPITRSDHRLVGVELGVDDIVSLNEPPRLQAGTSTGIPPLAHVPDEQRNAIHSAGLTLFAKFAESGVSRLRTNCSEEALREVTMEAIQAAQDAARSGCGVFNVKRRKKNKTTLQERVTRGIRRAVQRLRRSILAAPGGRVRKAKQIRFQSDQDVVMRWGLSSATLGRNDRRGWRRWAINEAPSYVRAYEHMEVALAQANPLHPRHRLNQAFNNIRGRGAFYDRYFRTSRSTTISSVRRADGTREFDPAKYKPMVADLVGKPMSTFHPNPGHACHRPGDDEEAIRATPDWWGPTFARTAKGVGPEVFKDVPADTTEQELWESLKRAPSGKAPGEDDISVDLLKILVETHQPTCPEDNIVLRLLVAITNASLRTGVVLPELKAGVIVLLPKVKPDGSFSVEPDEMRPITLLPEFGKLTTRIIADRLSTIFCAKPELIHRSARAFLKQGDIHQCVNQVLDVIEDANQYDKDLFICSYDLRKAFDSVQRFAIRASMERFNMPEQLIRFVMATLTGATSKVRTEAGLTDSFALSSSVRQGDPLSPLLFVLTTDALHAGFEANPLARGSHDGYVMGNPLGGVGDPSLADHTPASVVCVASSGYADDAIVMSESWDGMRRMHEWMCEYHAALHMNINSDKTVLVARDGVDADTRFLPGVYGLWSQRTAVEHRILMKTPSTTFRYLGVIMNLNLDWTPMKRCAEVMVYAATGRMRNYDMDIVQASCSVREYLLPKLDAALQYCDWRHYELEKLDSAIWRGIRHRAANTMTGTNSVPTCALRALSRVPHLVDYERLVKGSEAFVRLASTLPQSSDTSMERWRAAGMRATNGGRYRGIRGNRLLRAFQALDELGVHLEHGPPTPPGEVVVDVVGPALFNRLPWPVRCQYIAPVRSAWHASIGCELKVIEPGSWDTHNQLFYGHSENLELLVHTDGSNWRFTQPGSAFEAPEVQGFGAYGARNTGSGMVVSLPGQPNTRVNIGLPFCPSAASFAPEVYAILVALLAVPSHVHLTIVSDSDAAIGAIKNRKPTERGRIRGAARALVTTVQSLLRQRTGRCAFRGTRSHRFEEGDRDDDAVLNDAADAQAGAARRRHRQRLQDFLLNEERVVPWIMVNGRPRHVKGDLRLTLKRVLEDKVYHAWAERGTSGQLARSYQGGLRDQVNFIYSEKNPKTWWHFLQFVCQVLPTQHLKSRIDPKVSPACGFCPGGAPDTSRHVWACPATTPHWAAVMPRVHHALRSCGLPPEAWPVNPPTRSLRARGRLHKQLLEYDLGPTVSMYPRGMADLACSSKDWKQAVTMFAAAAPSRSVTEFLQSSNVCLRALAARPSITAVDCDLARAVVSALQRARPFDLEVDASAYRRFTMCRLWTPVCRTGQDFGACTLAHGEGWEDRSVIAVYHFLDARLQVTAELAARMARSTNPTRATIVVLGAPTSLVEPSWFAGWRVTRLGPPGGRSVTVLSCQSGRASQSWPCQLAGVPREGVGLLAPNPTPAPSIPRNLNPVLWMSPPGQDPPPAQLYQGMSEPRAAAWRSVVAHDRWAGICGVLPPGLMVAMAATRQERPAADQRAHSKQLEVAVKQIRRTLARSMTHLYDQRFGDAVGQGAEEDHILAKKAVSAVWRQTASVYGARAPRGMVSRTKCADAVLTALHHHRQLDPGPPPVHR